MKTIKSFLGNMLKPKQCACNMKIIPLEEKDKNTPQPCCDNHHNESKQTKKNKEQKSCGCGGSSCE